MPATDDRIVVDCPICRRVMWAGSTCHHGTVPPPADPPVLARPPAPVRKPSGGRPT